MRRLINISMGLLTLLLTLVALRGVFALEYALNPCEITLRPREVTPITAAAGSTVHISASYEVVRKGCRARFYPMVSWVTNYGAVQAPGPVNPGSFDVSAPSGPKMTGRSYTIPIEALPGTYWTSRVEADWDAWGVPLGLSQIHVVYRTVTVLVTEPISETP